jgi:signal transduction histidine kinase
MDGAVLAKATTPFFTTRDQGTGLGLAIVERIMRAHGSSIDLTSVVPRSGSGSGPSDAGAPHSTGRAVAGAPESAQSSGTCVSLVFRRAEA